VSHGDAAGRRVVHVEEGAMKAPLFVMLAALVFIAAIWFTMLKIGGEMQGVSKDKGKKNNRKSG
jgi:hypothetical protein